MIRGSRQLSPIDSLERLKINFCLLFQIRDGNPQNAFGPQNPSTLGEKMMSIRRADVFEYGSGINHGRNTIIYRDSFCQVAGDYVGSSGVQVEVYPVSMNSVSATYIDKASHTLWES